MSDYEDPKDLIEDPDQFEPEELEEEQGSSSMLWLFAGVAILGLFTLIFAVRQCSPSKLTEDLEDALVVPDAEVVPGISDIAGDESHPTDPGYEPEPVQPEKPVKTTVFAGEFNKAIIGNVTLDKTTAATFSSSTGQLTMESDQGSIKYNLYASQDYSEKVQDSKITLVAPNATYLSAIRGTEVPVNVVVEITEIAGLARITSVKIGEDQFFKANGGTPGTKTMKWKDKWHTVQRGETLRSIAEQYGMSTSQLRTLNPRSIYANDAIYAGDKLKVTVGYYE